MPNSNPNKSKETWDTSLTGTEWKIQDMRDLHRLVQTGSSIEDISKYLRRTISSVSGRLSANGYSVTKKGIKRKFFATKLGEIEDLTSSSEISDTTQTIVPQIEAEIVKDSNQELFIWFMRHAWEEGFTITIQELGASFQKPK